MVVPGGLPFLLELGIQLLEWEVLLPRLDSDVEPVLPRRERVDVRVVVCAVRVVREVEVEDILVVLRDGQVEVAPRRVALLAARGVAKGDKEALLLPLPRLRHGLVRLEAAGLAVDRELEVPDLQHVPRDALRRREDDGIRLRVPVEFHLQAVLRVRREIREASELLPELPRDRGIGILSEEVVLLPPHGLDLLSVILIGGP